MAKHFLIHGIVQGVFFRDATVKIARELGISGWVRNLSNGCVEIIAEGEKIDKFIDFLKIGPSTARVTYIEIKESKEKVQKGFFKI